MIATFVITVENNKLIRTVTVKSAYSLQSANTKKFSRILHAVKPTCSTILVNG